MERSSRERLALATVVATVAAVLALPAVAHGAARNVYRFYNVRTGTHFYTASDAERETVIRNDWRVLSYEGVAYALDTASPASTQALHRFYNRATGAHFYTASDSERDQIVARLSAAYTYEGVAYMVSPGAAAGAAPVYRFYNTRSGTHFYTASDAERDTVIARLGGVFTYEGIAFWVPLTDAAPVPEVATGEQAAADAVLAGLKALYPRFLSGVTVQIGETPNGYQAVCYYREGQIVVSPSHTASLETILSHEIWHVIDWRDNGCIDWRENVPPANAADYRG